MGLMAGADTPADVFVLMLATGEFRGMLLRQMYECSRRHPPLLALEMLGFTRGCRLCFLRVPVESRGLLQKIWQPHF